MKIDTLFLDAGGVLVFPNWTRIAETLARHGVSVAADVLAAADPLARRTLDLQPESAVRTDAERGWRYFDLVLAHAKLPLSDATDAAFAELRDYHRQRNLWELVPPDVPDALARLRALGVRMVVVSNANGTLCAHFDRLGLTRHFDHMLDSQDFGVEKPDPRLFRIALDRAGAEPETTVHVGDLYSVDVMGARAAGLGAILFDAADLYADHDCERVRSLDDLADRLAPRA